MLLLSHMINASPVLFAAVDSLLDLPTNVLELLSEFFTPVEWAKGPSQTCRALNGMLTPSLTLDLRLFALQEEVHLLWTSRFHVSCMLSTAEPEDPGQALCRAFKFDI